MQNLEGMNMVVVTYEMGFARGVNHYPFMAEGQVLVDTTDVDGFLRRINWTSLTVQFLSKIIDHNSDRVQVDA